MRIYDLAKQLGERFGISIKPSDLAQEIRETPEFGDLKSSIKSHASSVDDDVVERITQIYEARHGLTPEQAAEAEAQRQREAEEAARQRAAEEAKRREEIEARRRQLQQQALQERQAQQRAVDPGRLRREQETLRRGGPPAPGPRPVPPSRPAQPAATVQRPAFRPLPLPTIKPVSLPTAVPPAASPLSPPLPPQPLPPPPPPTAMPAPPQPPMTPPMARSAPAVEAAPTEEIGHTGPSRAELLARSGLRPDGQPLPPPPPSLRPDSPFRMRPAPPRRSGALPKVVEVESPRPAEEVEVGGWRRPGREDGEPLAPRLLMPEIEVMQLKAPRKGKEKEKARQPVVKKRTIKTVVRDEIDIKPSRIYGKADEFRSPIARRPRLSRPEQTRTVTRTVARPLGPVRLGGLLTVAEFADKLKLPPAEIVKKTLLMGQPLTINQIIEPDLCELICQDMGVACVVVAEGDETDLAPYLPEPSESALAPRPPVVTIMGHVDHGKTTLLDAYRRSRVTEQEVGGITQHIGAYRVETARGEVVFLDTPGHAAFTAMRARGAHVTDIVVLVVSADDGVMPQTVEAINHAREAGVPIVVAINKIDLPAANPQRVRQELLQYQIVSEELGGENIFVEISARQGTNLDQLLEMILLQAEVLELRADPACRAQGTIIESHLDPLRGAIATVLVHQGTLRCGDVFVCGAESGRVRVMFDDAGHPVTEARPSHPVEVIGLTGAPEVGETFLVMEEERTAREIAARRAERRRLRERASAAGARHISLETLHDFLAEGKLKELKVILKADVQGSVEAAAQSILKLAHEQVRVRILHKGTGAITESDVQLAAVSDAIVIGFHVRPDAAAAALAEREGVEIKTYQIIYELIEDFEKAIAGMLEKRYKEVVVGQAEIRQIFRISRVGNVAGCMVTQGEILRGAHARILRDGVVVHDGRVGSLRRIKEDVARVASGYECGILLEKFQDIKEGDLIETYRKEEIPAELAVS